MLAPADRIDTGKPESSLASPTCQIQLYAVLIPVLLRDHHVRLLPRIGLNCIHRASTRHSMQPSLFNQDLSLQTHLTGTSDPEPFDHAKHMAAMSQKRWNKIDKQKSVIANQTQLNQSNAQLHGPGHLGACVRNLGVECRTDRQGPSCVCDSVLV